MSDGDEDIIGGTISFEPDEGTEEPDEDEATEEESEETPDEETPEPAPEPDSEARMEEINVKLGKLRVHVAKRIGEILGEDAPFYAECELCTPFGVPGFRPPIELPPEVAGELYHLLGQHSPTDYQADTHSAGCRSCNGFGEVATGSKVLGQDRLPCVECSGLGWQATDDRRRAGSRAVVNGPAPLLPPPSPETSYMPEISAEDLAVIERLRAVGYAVVPPFVPTA